MCGGPDPPEPVESVSGPHPELDSDFALFCDVAVAALT
jgi:hypothetical protein